VTREEIDTAWSRALGEAVKEGEQFTRYHFAAIIRAQALEEAKTLIENYPFWLGTTAKAEICNAIESLKG